MKNVPTALKTHLESDVTSICTCWLITRRDKVKFGFTDHDKDLVISGQNYEAETGYMRTAIQNSGTLAVDNLEVDGFLDADSITERDLRAGKFDYAEVEVFLVNWANVSQGILKLRYGRFGEVSLTPSGKFTIELRGLVQMLSQTVGDIFVPECRADFGDAKCGIETRPPRRIANKDYEVGEKVVVRNSGTEREYGIPFVNPGFNDVVNATVPGWTLNDVGVTLFQTTELAAYTLDWESSLAQTIDLTTLFTDPDTQLASATAVLSWRQWAPAGYQEVGAYVAFYDDTDTLVGEYAHPYRHAVTTAGRRFSDPFPVPPTARTALFRLRCRRRVNKLLPSTTFEVQKHRVFLDDASLKITGGALTLECLTNGNFQASAPADGVVAGWFPSGEVFAVASMFSLTPHRGSRFLRTWGCYQEIELPGAFPITEEEIDTGQFRVRVFWWQANADVVGWGRCRIQWLRESTYPGSQDLGSVQVPYEQQRPNNYWYRREIDVIPPTGTRRFRVYFENNNGNTNINFASSYPRVGFDSVTGRLSLVGMGENDYSQFGAVEYECIVAGKTSTETDLSFSRTIDDEVEDGTVTWKVVKPAFTQLHTVTHEVDYDSFRDTTLTDADNFWRWGVVEFLTGENTGFSREIKTSVQSTGRINLRLPFPFRPAAGDQYVISRGCGKSRTHCTAYNNILNYRGFPDVPGTDQFFKVGKPV